MEAIMKDNGNKASSKDLENISGLMVKFILDNGKKV
jgi:hypothetical protein